MSIVLETLQPLTQMEYSSGLGTARES